MLKEFDYLKELNDPEDERQVKALNEIFDAKATFEKILVKLKTTERGKFVVIYAYDKKLYRYIVVNTVQIG